MKNKKALLLSLTGLLLGLAAVLLLSVWLRPHTFGGTLLQSPQPAYDFAFKGPENRTYRLSDFSGKVVLIFFGYTYCPDVCPITLDTLSDVLSALGTKADRVQAVMITVDPARDTPQRLEEYLQRYKAPILGLSGSEEDIIRAAVAYGVSFQRREGPTPEQYFMDHTATIMLVDPKGYLRVVYPYATRADAIVSDIRYILSH